MLRKKYIKIRNLLTERTELWSFEGIAKEYGTQYLSECDPDAIPYSMGDFNDLNGCFNRNILEAIRRALYGGRYGFRNEPFNPDDEYYAWNRAGNLMSIPENLLPKYLMENIDEEEICDWCVNRGFFELY